MIAKHLDRLRKWADSDDVAALGTDLEASSSRRCRASSAPVIWPTFRRRSPRPTPGTRRRCLEERRDGHPEHLQAPSQGDDASGQAGPEAEGRGEGGARALRRGPPSRLLPHRRARPPRRARPTARRAGDLDGVRRIDRGRPLLPARQGAAGGSPGRGASARALQERGPLGRPPLPGCRPRNLRGRALLDYVRDIRLASPNFSRTNRIAELLDAWLYRPIRYDRSIERFVQQPLGPNDESTSCPCRTS